MILTLLKHHFKENIRSHIFQKTLAIKILLGILGLFVTINLLFIGFFLGEILQEIFPNLNPVKKFTELMFYYFLIDLIIRFLLQKLPTISVTPYLHLPIKRNTIFTYLLVRSSFSFFNFIPLFVIVPFVIKVILPQTTATFATTWLLVLILLILSNNFIAFSLKKASNIRVVQVLLIFAFVITLFFFDLKGFIHISTYFQLLIYKIITVPILLILPAAWLASSYLLIYKLLKSRAYLEDLNETKTENYHVSTKIASLKKLGVMGELIQLELMLIWRNKRPRVAVIVGLLFALYGLVFFQDREIIESYAALIGVGVLMTGLVMINYGQFMLGWESNYFDLLLARNIRSSDIFLSKYWLLVSANVIGFILTTPYFLISNKIVFVNFAIMLFNSGINAFALLYLTTYNSKYIDLERSAFFNWQGTGVAQFLLIIPLIGFPLLIFLPFGILKIPTTAIWILGTMGAIGILFRNILLGIITKHFHERKYIISSGFRQK